MRSPRSSLNETPRKSGAPATSLSNALAITTAMSLNRHIRRTHVAIAAARLECGPSEPPIRCTGGPTLGGPRRASPGGRAAWDREKEAGEGGGTVPAADRTSHRGGVARAAVRGRLRGRPHRPDGQVPP